MNSLPEGSDRILLGTSGWSYRDMSMPRAYMLLNTDEFDAQLMKDLRRIRGVEEAYALYGVYDVVVRTKANTMNELKEIHNTIRKLKKVRQTLTMVAHEG